MNENPAPILALDPGKDKCGLAIVSQENGELQVRERRIATSSEVEETLRDWVRRYEIGTLVIGDATTSRAWHERVTKLFPGLTIETVAEAGSTLEARPLYWEANPPRGWRRLLPLSLQAPPQPVDDFAAVVLAKRYFASGKTR